MVSSLLQASSLPSSPVGEYHIRLVRPYLTDFRLVYTLVQRHIRELEGISPEIDELAAEALEEYDESAPLLKPSDEEER